MPGCCNLVDHLKSERPFPGVPALLDPDHLGGNRARRAARALRTARSRRGGFAIRSCAALTENINFPAGGSQARHKSCFSEYGWEASMSTFNGLAAMIGSSDEISFVTPGTRLLRNTKKRGRLTCTAGLRLPPAA